MIKNKYTINNGIAEVEVNYRGNIRICYLNEEVLSWPEFIGKTISYMGDYPSIYLNGKNVKVHKIIAKHLGLNLESREVDHKDQNKFNATFENIRSLTHSQNMQNSKARNKNGYKGVSNYCGHFRAYLGITVNSKYTKIYLGAYKTILEAARAYDIAAKKYFGEAAYINGISEDIVPVRITSRGRRKKCAVNE